MNVSETIKNHYKNNTASKVLNISFPDIDYDVPVDEVYYESMKLDESIFDSDSFEVVGCIASKFEVQIRDTGEELKGERVVVTISLKDVEDSTIPLFYGYVDTVNREAQKKMQSIIAYDALYSKGTIDVANWYNNLTFPITLYNLRNSLFSFIGVVQDDVALPNDYIIINKEYNPNTIKAIDFIKALCQINGCFGIMNREGVFEYRFLDTSYISDNVDISEEVNYYRSMDYKDYVVNPIDRLTIRQNTDDVGVVIGAGDNNYIIQGNMFTYNLEVPTIHTIATNIYAFLKDIEYIPFESSNNGYPWIEVGKDCILKYSVYDFDNSTSTTDVYKDVYVVAMQRSMTGIQNLVDTYIAQGQELQREFVSDISADISILQQTVDDIKKQLSTEITTYRNTNIITVEDGGTVDIADLVYEASQGNTILFHEEVSLEAEATLSGTTIGDILATVRYYVNGYRMPSHISEGLLLDGKNILSLMQFWEAGERDNNRVQAKLTVTGGKVTIPRLRANAYITVKQSDYNDAEIQVTKNPDKMVYRIGERIDYTGIVVCKTYFDSPDTKIDITSQCTFSPAEWSEVTSTDMIEVTVLYTETSEIGEQKDYTAYLYLYTQYITSLSVDKEPTKTEYFVGDNLNLDGIVVTAEYCNEQTGEDYTKDVTNSCVYSPANGYTFVSPEEGEIHITYTEDTISVETDTYVTVQAVEITQIKVTNPPDRLSYKVGDTLDYTGIVVKAFYNNGTRTVITNQCTFNPADGSTVTENTNTSVEVTYGSGQDAQTAYFDINIITFEGIEVVGPSQSSYEIGEPMDYTGLTVTGKWSDGSTEDVTSQCTFTPPNGTEADIDVGSIEIRYSKSGQIYEDSAELDIYEFTGIEVTTEPSSTSYWLGDETDYSGIVVTGTFSNDTTIDVTSECTFNPPSGTPTTMDMSEVNVSYERNGTAYHSPFSTQMAIEVKEPEPVLKYLIYTVDATNRKIWINGLNASEIAEDNLRNLIIPSTYTDPESGITFDLIIWDDRY